jgi:TetR/AcrR family transcriptional regulator, transcriptional repressor for nem operon
MPTSKAKLNKNETKQALLQHGLTLITKHGFNNTGLDAILKASGVPKGSFYYYFESKEAFGLAVLEAYKTAKVAWLQGFLNNKAYSPLNRLRLASLNFMEDLAASHFECGCLFGNLAQEMATLNEPFRLALFNAMQTRYELYFSLFQEAKAQGELPEDTQLPQLIHTYFMLLDGAYMQAKVLRSTLPFKMLDWFFFSQFTTPKMALAAEQEAQFAFATDVDSSVSPLTLLMKAL